MKAESLSRRIVSNSLVFLATILASCPVAHSQATDLLLYKFGVTGSIVTPSGPLLIDADGSLYGTAGGGPYRYGTVFRLSLTPDGWQATDLFDFNGLREGGAPNPGLIRDANGNFYGSNGLGGFLGDACDFLGCGTVFKLSPDSNGRLELAASYSFTGKADGAYPAGVVMDAEENIYGATSGSGFGSIFKLTPTESGWTEKTLHNFSHVDGAFPMGKLILDDAGNLYGTTHDGGNECTLAGTEGCGVVFELSPNSNGSWRMKVLHRFNGNDGAFPEGSLVFDKAGNLYGTAPSGGAPGCGYGCGVVFQLSPQASGHWKMTVLHTFTGGRDGGGPMGDVLFDASGSLVGTTYYGGLHDKHEGYGTVFRLTPNANGWQGAILHTFHAADDGAYPTTGLSVDSAGNLFGAANGGVRRDVCYRGCGVVYEILALAP